MKTALADDRARIQVGRISSFGLMEMSRQRLRTGVLEASTRQCPHCEGTGLVRTASSAALSALRLLEDEAGRGRSSLLTLRASREASFYILNRKRAELAEIEDRFGVRIDVQADGEDEGAHMSVEGSGPPPSHAPKVEAMPLLEDDPEDDVPEDEIDAEVEAEEREPAIRVHVAMTKARPTVAVRAVAVAAVVVVVGKALVPKVAKPASRANPRSRAKLVTKRAPRLLPPKERNVAEAVVAAVAVAAGVADVMGVPTRRLMASKRPRPITATLRLSKLRQPQPKRPRKPRPNRGPAARARPLPTRPRSKPSQRPSRSPKHLPRTRPSLTDSPRQVSRTRPKQPRANRS